MYLFSDGVSSTFDSEGLSQLWPTIILYGYQLRESSGDIEQCNGITDLEQRGDLSTETLDEIPDASIAHLEHFMMRVYDFLVPLQEIQSLTLNHVPLFEDVDKDIWQIALL